MASKNNWKNPALYKTRYCDFWMEGRSCKYGNRCWYAHGDRELRSVPHLENDFAARTVSLAEVVELLPPSKDRSHALTHANEVINNAQTDMFQRVTIPLLNSLALQMMSGKKEEEGTPTVQQSKTGGEETLKTQSSMNDLAPLLMQILAMQQQKTPSSIQQTQVLEKKQKVFSPLKSSRPAAVQMHSSLHRPLKAGSFVKKELSLSSLPAASRDHSSTSISDCSNPWSTPPSASSLSTFTHQEHNKDDVFKPIHRSVDSFCDSLFK